MANRIKDATFCSAVRIEPKVCELFNLYESSQIRVYRIIHRIRIHRMERLLLPMMGVVGLTAALELFEKSLRTDWRCHDPVIFAWRAGGKTRV